MIYSKTTANQVKYELTAKNCPIEMEVVNFIDVCNHEGLRMPAIGTAIPLAGRGVRKALKKESAGSRG